SSPDYMAEQLLDAHSVTYAVLTGDGMSLCVGSLPNPHLARETARALNEYRAEQWLAADDRSVGSICLPVQAPECAAHEVRSRADQPQFVQAILGTNPQSYAFGHPIFDPLHRALAETGRAFALHSLCQAAVGTGVAHVGGGKPSYYTEFHGGGTQEMMTVAMS